MDERWRQGWLMHDGRRTDRPIARFFFVVFAAVSVAVVLAGFARTFFLPVAHGTFRAPLTLQVHLSCFLAWVLLLALQAGLARSGNLTWHRQLGWSSAILIPAMVGSGVAVSLWATARDLKAGQGDAALAFLFGLFMDVAAFAALASVAVVLRRNPQVHKRLIVIATIGVLGPALGRIPGIGTVSNLISVVLVLSVAAYDLFSRSSVHAATLLGGVGLLASQFVQAPLGATNLWLSLARRVMARAPY